MKNKLTVFTKPWTAKDMSIEHLADFVKETGFDGVELAVRAGYQVTPDAIAKDLPNAVKVFKDRGLIIGSIAGDTDEKTIAACGEAGVPIIRICVGIDMKIGYYATEKKVRDGFDKLLPSLAKNKVAIGVQNHCDYMVGSAIGLMHLIENYDPKQVCAVLDPAHCAVDGEPETMALDIVWPHLGMMNFKSASHWRVNGPDEDEAKWKILWTTAQHAGYSWRTMINALRTRGYTGTICLPAEYSDPSGPGQLMNDAAAALVKKDLAYIKKLMAEDGTGAQKTSTDWKSTGAK
ncbi:MAG: sugar phosphate isomerase/epimerase [Spirochaetes bacterium]|nr:sugar phosphate isomerase/epimerase [Spirochaetota bacterium]